MVSLHFVTEYAWKISTFVFHRYAEKSFMEISFSLLSATRKSSNSSYASSSWQDSYLRTSVVSDRNVNTTQYYPYWVVLGCTLYCPCGIHTRKLWRMMSKIIAQHLVLKSECKLMKCLMQSKQAYMDSKQWTHRVHEC